MCVYIPILMIDFRTADQPTINGRGRVKSLIVLFFLKKVGGGGIGRIQGSFCSALILVCRRPPQLGISMSALEAPSPAMRDDGDKQASKQAAGFDISSSPFFCSSCSPASPLLDRWLARVAWLAGSRRQTTLLLRQAGRSRSRQKKKKAKEAAAAC